DVVVSYAVQSALRCEFPRKLRNQGRGIRLNLACETNHFLRSRHFEVESCLYGLPQQLHVAVLDVTPVAPEMHRNAVAPGQFCYNCRGNRIGLIRLAGLPQSSNVINVYSKFGHGEITGYSLQGTGYGLRMRIRFQALRSL